MAAIRCGCGCPDCGTAFADVAGVDRVNDFRAVSGAARRQVRRSRESILQQLAARRGAVEHFEIAQPSHAHFRPHQPDPRPRSMLHA